MLQNRIMMSVTIPPEVFDRLNKWCAEHKVNRSQSVAMMITSYIDAEESKPAVMAMANGFGQLMQNLATMQPEEAAKQMQSIQEAMRQLPVTTAPDNGSL